MQREKKGGGVVLRLRERGGGGWSGRRGGTEMERNRERGEEGEREFSDFNVLSAV